MEKSQQQKICSYVLSGGEKSWQYLKQCTRRGKELSSWRCTKNVIVSWFNYFSSTN